MSEGKLSAKLCNLFIGRTRNIFSTPKNKKNSKTASTQKNVHVKEFCAVCLTLLLALVTSSLTVEP